MERSNIFLLLIGLIGLTAFIMPDVFSMFVGQHNFYDEVTCHRCHVGEFDEMKGSSTGIAHIRAANNTNYTTYLGIGGRDYYPSNGTIYSVENKTWTWNGTFWKNDSTSMLISLDHNNNSEIDENEVCHLCHNSSITGKTGGHAITVRTCDDDWCHGNKNNVLNDPDLFNSSQTKFNVGQVLNNSDNIHNAFYMSLSNESAGYIAGEPFNHTMGNIEGDYFSKGYWACMGCHSEVPIEISITPGEYNHTDGVRRKYL